MFSKTARTDVPTPHPVLQRMIDDVGSLLGDPELHGAPFGSWALAFDHFRFRDPKLFGLVPITEIPQIAEDRHQLNVQSGPHTTKVYSLPLVFSQNPASWALMSKCSTAFQRSSWETTVKNDSHIATAYLRAMKLILCDLTEELFKGGFDLERNKYIINGTEYLTGIARIWMLIDSFKFLMITLRGAMEYSETVMGAVMNLALEGEPRCLVTSFLARAIRGSQFLSQFCRGHLSVIRLMIKAISNGRDFNTYTLNPNCDGFPLQIIVLAFTAPYVFFEIRYDNLLDCFDDDKKLIPGSEPKIKTRGLQGMLDFDVKALVEVLLRKSIDAKSIAPERGDYWNMSEEERDLHNIATLQSFNVHPFSPIIVDTQTGFAESVEMIFTSRIRYGKNLAGKQVEYLTPFTPKIGRSTVLNSAQCVPKGSVSQIYGKKTGDWTAVCIRPGTSVKIKVRSLGCKFGKGNTMGVEGNANIRFTSTFDPQRSDIFGRGISIAGKMNVGDGKYRDFSRLDLLDPKKEFTIVADADGHSFFVNCGKYTIFSDNLRIHKGEFINSKEDDVDEDGSKIPGVTGRYIVVAFKNCYIELQEIEAVQTVVENRDYPPKPENVATPDLTGHANPTRRFRKRRNAIDDVPRPVVQIKTKTTKVD